LNPVITDISEPGDPLAETAERAELRRSMRRVIDDQAPPERIRELDAARRFDERLYAALAELGVLGIDAPEALGGVGDVRDQLVVVEELAAGPTSMAAFMIAQYAVVQILTNVRPNG
jgi:acyl-CoA dehydrogenase